MPYEHYADDAHPSEEGIDLSGPWDLELPDDLALLGEQLSDDARHLAAQYPASAADTWSATASEPDRPKWTGKPWVRVAAALLVSFGVGTGLLGLAQFADVAQFAGQDASNTSTDRSPSKSTASATNPGIRLTQDRADRMASNSIAADVDVQAEPADTTQTASQGTPADAAQGEAGRLAVPPVQFQALSGPEQEAFLDLIETQGLSEPSLSI